MVTKAEHNTQVTPGELVNREDTLLVPGAAAVATVDPATELARLRARLEEARRLEPLPHERHCLDCFQRGRNAVIRLLEG